MRLIFVLCFLVVCANSDPQALQSDKSEESKKPENVDDIGVQHKNSNNMAEATEGSNANALPATNEDSALTRYRRLLKMKRIDHKSALEVVFALNSYEKRHKMVKLILEKICQVISSAQSKLSEVGYVPGDAFPEKEEVQSVLSLVIENVLFGGDIVLHFPDMSHNVLAHNKECNLTLCWGISFCNETLIFEGNERTLLDLMAQELNVVERSPDYTNPFKDDLPVAKSKVSDSKKTVQEDKQFAAKKDSKSKKQSSKGPRLSKPMRVEL